MGIERSAMELAGLAYEAALAPEKWQAFMARFAAALHARSAMLREVDYEAGHVPLFQTVGYDPAFVSAYRRHFVHLDYFKPAFLSVPVGAIIVGDEFVPWEQQRRSEFGNDYIQAQKVRYVMGSVLARDRHYHLQFGLQREIGQGEFDAADRQLIHLLAPHMARAVGVRRRLAAVGTERSVAADVLDRLRAGVILLDERGCPLFLNRAAERLAAATGDILAGPAGLALRSGKDTERLQALIADAAALASGRRAFGGGSLRTLGACGKPMLIQVVPLTRNPAAEHSPTAWLPASCVAVFVSPAGRARLSEPRLIELYGLTRAEARLAALLAAGASVESVAATLSVTVNTARKHIQSIFAKTGVGRQPELVALLLSDVLADDIHPEETAT